MSTEQTIAGLIKTNQEKYYRVAYSYVKNMDDALDIVNDAVVKALQNIAQLRDKRHLETWFYRILINESVSFVRKYRRIVYLDELPEIQLLETESADRDQYITLYSAIDKLSPKLRTVVILRFFEDMKFDEIAEITSTKLSTVKARLYRALELLKIDIEGEDYV